MPHKNRQMNYIAIMAGGVGSRFWPASREARPKQFLDITGSGESLLQMTVNRFKKIVPVENIFIVTNKKYKDLVKEQLPELTDNQIIGEPSRNNTAPCVAFTALKLAGLDPNANMVVAPSDHLILKEDAFLTQIQKALDFASQNDALLTLGIEPSRPDTGYGYIHFAKEAADGVHPVKAFKEKPDLAKAQSYVQSGEYLWNAGIFIWNVKSILKAFQQNANEIYQILNADQSAFNSIGEQAYMDRVYPTTPSISIDYAIMEKADNVYTLPSDIGWSDLGTWGSLHAESPKDDDNNVVLAEKVVLAEAKNNMIRLPKGKLAVIKGLEDYIIIDEGDVLLIYPKSEEQEIKQVRKGIENEFGEEYL
ncbi:MAG TPA: mannose-1-phosphate guanylyltransferase [Saprospiraceae bacterium]|nr:mannose-1-phosphate guanylyltransferase [Saprospiraceae bacterium]